MTPSLVVSTRGRPVPYITLDELKRTPVFSQLRSLVPNSSEAERDAELRRIIMRASSMINGEVNQNLAATLDNEVGDVRVSPLGDLCIHTRSSPIQKVLSVSVGPDPTRLSEMGDLSGIVIDPWRITIPRAATGAGFNLPGAGLRPGGRLWAQWSYINGFPVTVLAASASAGDTQITVKESLGIVPNQTLLAFNDGRLFEEVIPTAVNGNVLTVPPLMFDHPAGCGVTDLPDVVKEATLLLISRLHDTWSLTMNVVSHDGNGSKKPAAGPARALCDAAVMVAPYRRVW